MLVNIKEFRLVEGVFFIFFRELLLFSKICSYVVKSGFEEDWDVFIEWSRYEGIFLEYFYIWLMVVCFYVDRD